jgi:hypothetical protein
MIGQRFAFRTSIVGLGDDDRTALPDAGNVAVEIFKRERELIGIQAFGATPELRPLQLVEMDWRRSISPSRLSTTTASRAPDGATALYRTADFRDRTAYLILLKPADSKKRVRYILCGFLRRPTGESRSPDALRCAPVDANCAGDKAMLPSCPVIRGHTNPPRSSRLVNKHSPLPSQNRTLTICARLPLKANRWPQNGSFFQRLLDQHGQSIHALSHVGVTQRQVHLHARRNDHHRAASRSRTCWRTASGLLPLGAKTRRPSGSCTGIIRPVDATDRSAPQGLTILRCRFLRV